MAETIKTYNSHLDYKKKRELLMQLLESNYLYFKMMKIVNIMRDFSMMKIFVKAKRMNNCDFIIIIVSLQNLVIFKTVHIIYINQIKIFDFDSIIYFKI